MTQLLLVLAFFFGTPAARMQNKGCFEYDVLGQLDARVPDILKRYNWSIVSRQPAGLRSRTLLVQRRVGSSAKIWQGLLGLHGLSTATHTKAGLVELGR